MIQEYLNIVLRSLIHRKLRSALTVIAIVIGTAAVIALITIAQSLQSSIEESFEAFGADKIIVMPAAVGGQPNLYTGMNKDDLEAVERVADLEEVIPYFWYPSVMSFQDEEKRLNYLLGFPPEKSEALIEDFGLEMREGRVFTTNSYQAVIGPLIADEMFDEKIRVKNRVEIAGKKFEVVGIFESIGNPEDDSQVYIPIGIMRDLFDDDESVSMIQVEVKKGKDIDEVAAKIEHELGRLREEEEFEVVTAEQLLDQLGAVLGIVQAVLVSIATISLIVGGVGIANVMYTTVIQRTREIGIMKAVGAKNRTIMGLFVLEAGLMGFLGGIIGAILGILIALAVEAVASSYGWTIFKVSVELWVILFGVGFSTIVGMASGMLPARQASKLKPVDALRYGK